MTGVVARKKHSHKRSTSSGNNVVTALFPDAITLFEYFQRVLGDRGNGIAVVRPTDSLRYRNTIQTSYIIPSKELMNVVHRVEDQGHADDCSAVDDLQPYAPIGETISRFIAQVVHQVNSKLTTYTGQNCLALGYRSRTLGSDMTLRSHMDIECVFVNTLHGIISTQVWQLMAARIGEEQLMRILSQPVFLQASHSCFIQISGSPVSDLIHQPQRHLRIGNGRRDGVDEDEQLHSFLSKLLSNKHCANDVSEAPRSDDGEDTNDGSEDGRDDFNRLFGDCIADCQDMSSITLRDSYIIPRHSIFYHSSYQKKLGLPSAHALIKTKRSCSGLADKLFLPVLLALIRLSSMDKYRRLLRGLRRLFRKTRERYLSCPMASLLHRYCSIGSIAAKAVPLAVPDATQGMDTTNNDRTRRSVRPDRRPSRRPQQQTIALPSKEIALATHKRKRGCRSGRLVRSKKTTTTHIADDNPLCSDPNPTHSAAAYPLSKKRKGSAVRGDADLQYSKVPRIGTEDGSIDHMWMPFKMPELITVGQRLMDRANMLCCEASKAMKRPRDSASSGSGENDSELVDSGGTGTDLNHTGDSCEEDRRSSYLVGKKLFAPELTTTTTTNGWQASGSEELTCVTSMGPPSDSDEVTKHQSMLSLFNDLKTAIYEEKYQLPDKQSTSHDNDPSPPFQPDDCDDHSGMKAHTSSSSKNSSRVDDASLALSNDLTPFLPTTPTVAAATHPSIIAAHEDSFHGLYPNDGNHVHASYSSNQLYPASLSSLKKNKRKKVKRKIRATLSLPSSNEVLPPRATDLYHHHHHRSRLERADSGILHHLSRPFYTQPLQGNQSDDKQSKEAIAIDHTRSDLGNPSKPSLPSLVETSDLLSVDSSIDGVSAFIKAVCRRVFPLREVWGTRHNLNRFLSALDKYIKLDRHETFSLGLVVHGIRLSDIPWLKDISEACGRSDTGSDSAGSGQKHQRIVRNRTDGVDGEVINDAPTTSSRRHLHAHGASQLFYRFMLWLYCDFINPLLSACFYATEAEGSGSRTLFYRRPVWSAIVRRGQKQLRENFIQVYLDDDLVAMVNPPKATTLIPVPRVTVHEDRDLTIMHRSNTVPATIHASPTKQLSRSTSMPTTTMMTMQSSILFNDLIRTQCIQAPQLSEANNSILHNHFPRRKYASTTSAEVEPGVNHQHRQVKHHYRDKPQSARLRHFLQRVPAIRWVPKKASVRPITNLRCKKMRRMTNSSNISTTSNSSSSMAHKGNNGTCNQTSSSSTVAAVSQYGEVLTNSSLYNCLHVLRSVLSSCPALTGFGAAGFDDVYLKLLNYKKKLSALRLHHPDHNHGHDQEHHHPHQEVTGNHNQQFYIAVFDIDKCYDNIDTALLYDLVSDILTESASIISKEGRASPVAGAVDGGEEGGGEGDQPMNHAQAGMSRDGLLNVENVIHKYTVAHPMRSMDRNTCKSIRYVALSGNIIPFQEASAAIAQCYPYSVISDAVVYPKITYREVLQLIRVHLFQHIVKIPVAANNRVHDEQLSSSTTSSSSRVHPHDHHSTGKEACFNQIKGIPQGSVLSPLLCSLYYGNAERDIFGSREAMDLIGLDDKTLVMRMADDYIVISTDQSCVQQVLQRAHSGLKLFGGGVNLSKTRVSFEALILDEAGDYTTLPRIDGQFMPWCGLLIDTHTLEVTCDFKRMLSLPLAHCVLTEHNVQPGLAFRRAIKSFMKSKCHALVLDARLNGKLTVVRSLYRLFLVAASRTMAYLHKLQSSHRRMRCVFVVQCIKEAIGFGCRLVKNRTITRKITRALRLEGTQHPSSLDSIVLSVHKEQESDGKELPSSSTTTTSSSISSNEERRRVLDRLAKCCVVDGCPDGFGRCPVRHHEVCWLGYQAFIAVFSRRPCLYSHVVTRLSRERDKYRLPTCRDGGANDDGDGGNSDDAQAVLGALKQCELEICSSCRWR